MSGELEKVETPVASHLQDLAKSASQILGYHALAWQRTNTGFLCELMAAGHTPYSERSVNAYKDRKRWQAWFDIQKFKLGAILIGILGITGSIVGEPPPAICIPIVISSAIMMVFGIITSLTAVIEITVEWRERLLYNYPGAIPANIIQKALDIKTAFPNADLRVQELTVGKRVVDPFLCVIGQGNQRYFVAVWDEPTFEDRQIE